MLKTLAAIAAAAIIAAIITVISAPIASRSRPLASRRRAITACSSVPGPISIASAPNSATRTFV